MSWPPKEERYRPYRREWSITPPPCIGVREWYALCREAGADVGVVYTDFTAAADAHERVAALLSDSERAALRLGYMGEPL